MGTLMPLSQTIIGDIIPPRQRGKYQGLMGGVFGLSSILGPLVGGFVTDNWGWRYLFFITLPVGVFAFFGISRFLHLEHTPRETIIDKAGIALLSMTLILLLVPTSWAARPSLGARPRSSACMPPGVVALIAFVAVERRAVEPVLPLRLFRSSLFTLRTSRLRGLGGDVRRDDLPPGLRPGRARERRPRTPASSSCRCRSP